MAGLLVVVDCRHEVAVQVIDVSMHVHQELIVFFAVFGLGLVAFNLDSLEALLFQLE